MMAGGMLMAIMMNMRHRHHVIVVEARRCDLIATNRVGKTGTENAKQIGESKN